MKETFIGSAEPPKMDITVPHPEVSLDQVLAAFKDVLKRARLNADTQSGEVLC